MKITRRGCGILTILAGLAFCGGGCVIDIADVCLDDDCGSGDVEASASYYRVVSADWRSSLIVVGANGDVTVNGVPGISDIVIHAQRRVRADSRKEAEEYLHRVRVSVSGDADAVWVETDQPRESGGRTYLVDYEITVPSHFAVEVINGNGRVELRDIDAEVQVENGNGDVVLQDQEGSSWISLGNGEIRADVNLPPGGHLVHGVGNGGIRLTLQRNVSAEFSAQVGNGAIHAAGLEFTSWVSGPRFAEGILGTGEGTISLSVGNGWIQLQGR